MFNVLVSADETAWESDQRMGMQTGRFLEHSGDESESISATKPETLRALERVQSLLLYEMALVVPALNLSGLDKCRHRVGSSQVTFRFAETGRFPANKFEDLRRQGLQSGNWGINRTHWAVQSGRYCTRRLVSNHTKS